jgi:hypothetical protein
MGLGGAANALLQKGPAIPIEWEFGRGDIPISAGNPRHSPGRSQGGLDALGHLSNFSPLIGIR